MAIPLNVLIVEDSDSDAALDVRALKKAGYKVTHEIVATAKEMKAALDTQTFGLIISDHSLPQFDSLKALAILKESGQDIPFIVVSGVIGEETAVKLMKAGAHDYIMKGDLSRLGAAVERELREVQVRRESKQAEEALRVSEQNFRDSIEKSPLGIRIVNKDGKTLYTNRTLLNIYGYSSLKELENVSRKQCLTPESYAEHRERVKKRKQGEHVPFNYEISIVRSDGQVRHLSVSRGEVLWDGEKQFEMMYQDITDRKQAEKALLQSEEKYRLLTETSLTGIGILQDDKYVYVNERFARMHGYTVEELLDVDRCNLVHPDERESIKERAAKRLQGQLSTEVVTRRRLRKDGQTFWAEERAVIIEYQGKPAIMANSIDITERKQAEETLRQSEEKYRLLTESSLTGIFIDQDNKFVYVNERFAQMHGYAVEEMVGMGILDTVYPDEKETARERIARGFTGRKKSESVVRKRVRKDGQEFWTEMMVTPVSYVGKPARMGNVMDITERKRMSEELGKSEELYRSLFNNMLNGFAYCKMLFEQNKPHDFIYLAVNGAFETLTGLKNVTGKKVSEVIPGIGESDPQLFELYGRVALTCIPETMEIYVKALKMWFSLAVYSPQKEYFVAIFDVITERKLAQENLSLSYGKLQKTLESAVAAMASITEIRDLYTAGHQVRVTALACAMAKEMGLSAEAITDIRMGGVLHDIGKMYVPAEILSKPGKLSDIEFMIIKNHPQIGYDIVKKIDFPCQVAEMIIQHHERLDGSGYPKGLKDEDITVEAKVLAVADVVEAMASHRPYRPALGIDKALEEVTRNKGKLYDPGTVDACLKLFNEKGFKFE